MVVVEKAKEGGATGAATGEEKEIISVVVVAEQCCTARAEDLGGVLTPDLEVAEQGEVALCQRSSGDGRGEGARTKSKGGGAG